MAYSAASGGGSTWTPENDKVDSEVSRITSAGGPLMQQAKTDGLATAQRRGLLNSSMAVGSAQGAVLAAALPMAQQNSQQTAAKNLSNQEYGQSRGLAEQKFGYDTSLSDQNFRQQQQITDQQYRNQLGAIHYQGDWNSRLQVEKAQQDAALSDQDYRQKAGLLAVDNASKEKIASWNVGQYEKERAMSALTAMEQLYAGQFTSIGNNTDMPAETRNAYLQHIASLRDSSLNLVQQMYGIQLNWASPGAPTTAG